MRISLISGYHGHFLSASIAIFSSFGAGSASVVVVETAFYMLLAVRDWSWPGTSFVPVAVVAAILCW